MGVYKGAGCPERAYTICCDYDGSIITRSLAEHDHASVAGHAYARCRHLLLYVSYAGLDSNSHLVCFT